MQPKSGRSRCRRGDDSLSLVAAPVPRCLLQRAMTEASGTKASENPITRAGAWLHPTQRSSAINLHDHVRPFATRAHRFPPARSAATRSESRRKLRLVAPAAFERKLGPRHGARELRVDDRQNSWMWAKTKASISAGSALSPTPHFDSKASIRSSIRRANPQLSRFTHAKSTDVRRSASDLDRSKFVASCLAGHVRAFGALPNFATIGRACAKNARGILAKCTASSPGERTEWRNE